MTQTRRTIVGVLLTILAVVPAVVHADTVQLSVGDGRLSLVAVNATPAQIFDAWSKAGGILVVNADRLSGPPLTLTLENVPEEQALDTLLRPVTGYLARRRTSPAPSASIFDRIVIVPTPAGTRPATTMPAPAAPPPFAAPPAPGPTFPPASPVAPPPGPARIIGPDGQPVEDDQAGAPPPPPSSAAGDAPDTRTPPPVRGTPVPQPQPQPAPPQPSAPAGVPRPGMVVPGPQGASQPR